MAPSGNTDLLFALECARRALASNPPSSRDSLPASPTAGRAAAVITHRLSRLVVNSSQQNSFDGEDWERITSDALAHTHAAFQLVGHTARVVSLLDEADVEFLVIKGVALGALSQTPAGRGAGDVDILVAPRDVPRVHEIFLGNEFRPALALPDMSKPGTWRTWSFLDREATYLGHSIHIDLHWRISSQRHLFPSFAELYARKTEVTIADNTVPTLSLGDSLAAACYHAYFDQFQPLRSLVDVIALVGKTTPESLPPGLSRSLARLMAGVISLVAQEFPEVVEREANALLSGLPSPAAIVRKRFDQAVSSPRQSWEENPHLPALLRKLRAEAHFDNRLEVLPRFVGKRLFDFPAWSTSHPTTPLGTAWVRRWKVESSRRRTTR